MPLPHIAFACAHMTDERLFAAQAAALSADHECRIHAFRDHDTLAGMAAALLAASPPRFTLIGLSLGGYLAFEVVRRAPERLARLVLLDTTAAADTPARRAGRLADIEKVRSEGLDALIAELPLRWLHPEHRAKRPDLVALLADMARSIGARGQYHQQQAMLARPDSHADLAGVRVPVLVACGREDAVTPLADHEAMRACVHGATLEVIEHSGHLSTIEQPERVNALLGTWLKATATAG